jgi:DNA-directed RNA polymerase subunit alpha
MLDFQVPRISSENVEENRGSFTIEPLDRGFGYTFGNSLRRVLLSSLAGAAVTSVRIEGVAHEFSTIRGVKEDVTDIVLNLKGIVCRMHSDATEIEAPLVVTGPGEITAKDIDLPSGVEILNPDAHIATLEKKTKLEVYLTIGRGRGYRPAEENKSPDQPIGVIPIDSIFSPVRRVAYNVEQARVGQRTDYDKLTLDIETDGSIDPPAALREAAEILISQLAIFTDADRVVELREAGGGVLEQGRGMGIQDQIPTRQPNAMDDILAQRDPQLRQEVDRRSDRDPACAGARPARRVRSAAMRHQRQRYQLSRSASHRKSLLINLTKEVIEHERITTSEAKAKAVKPELEKLITLAKRGPDDLHARRQALSALGQDKFAVYKLFDELAPRYSERPGGYTRILKLGPRRSDSTEMVLLELV